MLYNWLERDPEVNSNERKVSQLIIAVVRPFVIDRLVVALDIHRYFHRRYRHRYRRFWSTDKNVRRCNRLV